MSTHTLAAVQGLTIGVPQHCKHFTVFPLSGGWDAPEHIGLSEAFASGVIAIGEIDQGGRVPEVLVTNSGALPVLIVSGEEMKGAKQNRVVNTTILVREKGSTVLPVSCTEAGRWSYTSKTFDDSKVVMSRKARVSKLESVSDSLRRNREFRSDQGEVWAEVDALHAKLGTRSRSAAMYDAFETRKQSFADVLAAFPLVEQQCGMLVLQNHTVLGMEVVASPAVYQGLHEKLVRSYTIDTIDDDLPCSVAPPEETAARKYLELFPGLPHQSFPSVGYGEDYRFEDEQWRGMALVHQDALMHAVFFPAEPSGRRRRYGVIR